MRTTRLSSGAGLIFQARLRAGWQRAREQAFAILVLSPIVLGGLAWIGWRYLDLLRAPLAAKLAEGGAIAPALLGLVAVAALWPATRREALPAGDDLLDVLPVSERLRFAVTVVSGLGRSVVAALLFTVACFVFLESPDAPGSAATGAPDAPGSGEVAAAATSFAAAVVAFAVASLLALAGVLATARAGRRLVALVAVAAVFDAGLASFGLAPPLGVVAGWVAAPFIALGEFALQAPRFALGLGETPGLFYWGLADGVLAVLALLGARSLYRGRRRLDPQVTAAPGSKRASSAASRSVAGGFSAASPTPSSPAPPSLAPSSPAVALVRRDLRLIRRGFSPAAISAVVLSAWVLGLTALVVADASLAPSWRLRAAIAGGALAVLALEAVVPFLIAHQLPRLWIERSLGVDLDTIWRAKLSLAALLAVAPTVLALVLVWLAPGTALERLAASGLLVAAAGVCAALVGLASFEIAEQPLIGYLFAGSAALAIAALLAAYPAGWWLWLALAGILLSLASERASARLRRMEVAS